MSRIEVCQNPFRRRRCGRTDITVAIIYKGKKCLICKKCWKELSEGRWKDEEWGE